MDKKIESERPDIDRATIEKIERNQQIYADIVARYYGDPDFKSEVDQNPATVLLREGLDVPKGVKVELLFNTDKLIHIVLPLEFP